MYRLFLDAGPRRRAVLVMTIGGVLALPFLCSRKQVPYEQPPALNDHWPVDFEVSLQHGAKAQFAPLPMDTPTPVRPQVTPTWIENKSSSLADLAKFSAGVGGNRPDSDATKRLPIQPLRPWLNNHATEASETSNEIPNQNRNGTSTPVAAYHSPWVQQPAMNPLTTDRVGHALQEESSRTPSPIHNGPVTLSSPRRIREPLWPDQQSAAMDIASIFQPSARLHQPTAVAENLPRNVPPIRDVSQSVPQNLPAPPLVAAPQLAPATPTSKDESDPKRQKHYIYQPRKT